MKKYNIDYPPKSKNESFEKIETELNPKPWRHYSDGCPWKQFRDGVLCCNGNIIDFGVFGYCSEEECPIYHFIKRDLQS